jgi:hypothetical protein
MYVRIEGVAPPKVTVVEPDDFTRFHLDIACFEVEAANHALEQLDVGYISDGRVGWVAVAAIPRLAGPSLSAEWGDGYDRMIAFAKSKNWISDDDLLIQAHIERS